MCDVMLLVSIERIESHRKKKDESIEISRAWYVWMHALSCAFEVKILQCRIGYRKITTLILEQSIYKGFKKKKLTRQNRTCALLQFILYRIR